QALAGEGGTGDLDRVVVSAHPVLGVEGTVEDRAQGAVHVIEVVVVGRGDERIGPVQGDDRGVRGDGLRLAAVAEVMGDTAAGQRRRRAVAIEIAFPGSGGAV